LFNERIVMLNKPLPFDDGSNIIDKVFHPVNLISEFPGLYLHLFLCFRGCGYLH
jgi:hypothetical protein